ncbi:MAG: energy-coupling factor transporter transmembrane protein EcfT [Adlercreutzia sp.]|nr:energy-coupling factor transporter transmembrane protein EcfT [Adlercreutzia sp.]
MVEIIELGDGASAPRRTGDLSPSVGASAQTQAGFMLSAAEHGRRRVDPRVALAVLVLLNVAVFVSGSALFEVVLVAADGLLMAWCHRGRLAAAWLLAYGILFFLSVACMLAGPFFMPVGACLVMIRRLFPTAMFAAAMISTTYLGEIAYALQSWGLSGRMTVAVCVGLRFFPTALREARAVREAMTTRGIRLTPAAIVRHPALLLENFMVPYLHRISLVADELGDAVMARGVETTRKRTCYYPMRLGVLDGVTLVLAAVLAVAAVVGKVMA